MGHFYLFKVFFKLHLISRFFKIKSVYPKKYLNTCKTFLILLLIFCGVSLNSLHAQSSIAIIDKSIDAPLILEQELLKDNISTYNTNTIFKDGNISTVHLFSHGRSGELLINGKWLQKEEIASFVKIQYLLSNTQYLNIYGCEFAKGQKGRDAVLYLENTLGVSVAASTNITGKDGDWELEVGNTMKSVNLSSYKYNLQDTDADGIDDSIDLDDDNDGILDTDEYCDDNSANVTILSNSFELPLLALTDLVTPTAAVTDWTTTGGVNLISNGSAFGNPTAITGTQAVGLQGISSISQDITLLVEGIYSLSFYLANRTSNAQTVEVLIDGVLRGAYTPNHDTYQIKIISNLVLSAGTHTLEFAGVVSAGDQTAFLDHVAMGSIAVACDTDNDGTPDHLDLDSDNDGCPDAVEAGHGQIILIDSTIATSGDVGSNGLDNDVETNDGPTATINYTITQTNPGTDDFKDGTVASCKDYGDAPSSYGTSTTYHIINGNVFLGAQVDDDPNGQPSDDAGSIGIDGDDGDGNDDEDGVTFTSLPVAGSTETVDVEASVAGNLSAWIDYNGNGTFSDAGEQIFSNESLSAGVNSLTYNIPTTAAGKVTYARFRFSTADINSPTGNEINGEVEDYKVYIDNDNDNDGIGDAIDIDDDNDGIVDTLECYSQFVDLTNNIASGKGKIAGELDDIWTVQWIHNPSYNHIYSENDYAPVLDTNTYPAYVIGNIVPGAWLDPTLPDNNWISYNFTGSVNGPGLHRDLDLDGIIDEHSTTGGTTPVGTGDAVQVKFKTVINLQANSEAEIVVTSDNFIMAAFVNGIEQPNSFSGGFDAANTAKLNIGLFQGSNVIEIITISGPPYLGLLISVSTVSSSCDSDGDGIIDKFDLDSDNDGIVDLVEAGGIDLNGDGIVDDITDTDGDGLVDLYDTDNGGTALIFIDSDSDSIPDYLDTDSDNDGCPDALEGAANFTTADLTSSNNLADADEGAVDSVTGVPTNIGSPQATTADVTTATQTIVDATALVDQSVSAGSEATFAITSATATSTTTYTGTAPNTLPDYSAGSDASSGINYQWYIGNPDAGGTLIDGTDTNYTGFNSASLAIGDVTGLDGTEYCLLITHDDNVCIREINCATLTELDPCTDGAIAGTITANDPDADGINNVCDLDDDNDGILDAVECVESVTFFDWQSMPSLTSGDSYILPYTRLDGSIVNITVEYVSGTATSVEAIDLIAIRPASTFYTGTGEETIRGTSGTEGQSFFLRFTADEPIDFLATDGENQGSNEPAMVFSTNGNPWEIQDSVDPSLVILTGVGTSTVTYAAVNVSGPYGAVLLRTNTATVLTLDITQGLSGLTGVALGIVECFTDNDNDLIPDHLDTDSDNDGCPDALEGAANFTTTDLTSSNNLADADEGVVDSVTGVPTNVGSPQATTADVTTATQTIVDATALVDQSVSAGSEATFAITSATATSTTTYTGTAPNTLPDYSAGSDASSGINYQWYIGNPDAGGTLIDGTDTNYTNFNSASLAIGDVTGLDGTEYCLLITHDDNVCVREINCAILTLLNDPPTATDNESLSNASGPVVQEVILEDDGSGADSDPDGSLVAGSIDLDPGTAGQQTTLVVAGEGTWSVDGLGNVTFTPEAGFTDDPTPITYTIEDNDGNVSNTAAIVVDYIPVASDDASLSNTTNTPAVVDVLANDTTGDTVDPTTVQIVGTVSSGDPLVVAGEGTWTVNPITGAITFTPEAGFLCDPTDVTYVVADDEGNISAPGNVNVEYDCLECVDFTLWVNLEGSLIVPQTGMYAVLPMRTTLNDSRLLPGQFSENPFSGDIYSPPGQSYNIAPWNYAGTEGMNYDSGGMSASADAGYPSMVVDWVLVSLRTDPEDGSEALCQRAGLLHSDGHIEFLANADCCSLDPLQSYYIVIEHRNHLIIMSATAISIVNGTITYDFRDKQSYLSDPFSSGIFNAQKEVLPGVFAMYAGNGDQTSVAEEDTDITAADYTKWLNNGPENRTYNLVDYNMDGDVSALDFNLWQTNSPRFTSVIRD